MNLVQKLALSAHGQFEIDLMLRSIRNSDGRQFTQKWIGSAAMKLKPLSEQVIVITGASSGIGLVTARLAARRGAKVFLIARGDQALAEVVSGIRAEGGTAEYAKADVADR